MFGTDGKFYTLGVDKLPGGRGHGEPIRLMIDLGNEQDIVQLLIYKPGQKLLVASADGRGFIVNSDEVLAQTRSGKQVLIAAGRRRGAGLHLGGGRHGRLHRREPEDAAVPDRPGAGDERAAAA